jgi:hypothetical protein
MAVMTADEFLDELDVAIARTVDAARDSGKPEVAAELTKCRYRLAAARERDRNHSTRGGPYGV